MYVSTRGCVHICTHVHGHVHTPMGMHIITSSHTHAHMHTSMCVCPHAHTLVCACVGVRAHAQVHMCVHMCVGVCTCLCVHVRHIHLCLCTHLGAHAYTCVCTHMRTHLCTHAHQSSAAWHCSFGVGIVHCGADTVILKCQLPCFGQSGIIRGGGRCVGCRKPVLTQKRFSGEIP